MFAAKEYFSNLRTHVIDFNKLSSDKIERSDSDDELDNDDKDSFPTSGEGFVELAFLKKKVDDRKPWIKNADRSAFVDYREAQKNGLNYSEFINKDVLAYSVYDNDRSLPHLFDGLKTSQRKVLYACFKKKLKRDMKVAQLAGYIGEHSVLRFVQLAYESEL